MIRSPRPAEQITTPDALAEAVDEAMQHPVVAVDTEAASFHRYVDRVYLIQLSTPDRTVIIDPLAIEDLHPLGALLADPAHETIFHDGDYDLRVLDRDYAFRVRGLFDTRIAAQLAGEPAIGLAALLEKYCGATLSKQWQRADWSIRPLPPEMLAYAADDTRFLIALRDALRVPLERLGRLDWAREEFARVEGVRWAPNTPSGQEHLRYKGAHQLDPRARAVLHSLHDWRRAEAERRDRAEFRIVSHQVLVTAARVQPRSTSDLRRVKGLSNAHAARYGSAILNAVHLGSERPEEPLSKQSRPLSRRVREERTARLERLKTIRNQAAKELGLDPGLVCSKSVLEAIAAAAPKTDDELRTLPEVRHWQVDLMGQAFIDASARD